MTTPDAPTTGTLSAVALVAVRANAEGYRAALKARGQLVEAIRVAAAAGAKSAELVEASGWTRAYVQRITRDVKVAA